MWVGSRRPHPQINTYPKKELPPLMVRPLRLAFEVQAEVMALTDCEMSRVVVEDAPPSLPA